MCKEQIQGEITWSDAPRDRKRCKDIKRGRRRAFGDDYVRRTGQRTTSFSSADLLFSMMEVGRASIWFTYMNMFKAYMYHLTANLQADSDGHALTCFRSVSFLFPSHKCPPRKCWRVLAFYSLCSSWCCYMVSRQYSLMYGLPKNNAM